MYFAVILLAGSVLLISSILWIRKKLKHYSYVTTAVLKLPGLPFTPFFGTLHYSTGSPEHVFENNRIVHGRFGHLYQNFLGPIAFINISSHENAEIVLGSSETFKKSYINGMLRNWLGNSTYITNEDKNWHLRRNIMRSILKFEKLEKYYNNTINDKIEELRTKLRNAKNLEQVDTYELTTRFVFEILFETTLGVNYNEYDKSQQEYLKNIERLIALNGERLTEPWLCVDLLYKLTRKGRELEKTAQSLRRFTDKIIAEQEGKFVEKDASDLNTILEELLLIKYKENTINNEAIREEIDTIIYKGYSLIRRAISFTLMILACNRECQDKLFEEISETLQPNKSVSLKDLEKLKYLDRCIKETLRLYPVSPIINRKCERMTTHEGLKIPRSCYVKANISLYELHRDSNVFPDPEKFDPERFSPEPVTASQMPKGSYIPFGGGARKCPGEEMCVLEIKAAVVALLRDYIIEPVDTPESLVLLHHLELRPSINIKVKFIPRQKVA